MLHSLALHAYLERTASLERTANRLAGKTQGLQERSREEEPLVFHRRLDL